jgi:hypothetical protein
MTSTLFRNDNTFSTLEILQKVLKEPELNILHESCSDISALIIAYHDSISEPSSPNRNQIRIDDKYYALSTKDLDILFNMLAVNKDNHFKKKKNILRDIITEGLSAINNKDSSSKFIHIFKALAQYDNLGFFIHDYFQHMLLVNKHNNYKLKLTSICINFSQTLIRFVIAQMPSLNCIDSCFHNIDVLSLNNTQIKFIVAFIKLIFEKDSKEKLVKQFFESQNVNNKHIIELVINHFKELFISNSLKNTIYNDEIKEIAAQFVKDYQNYSAFITENQGNYVTLGYYWISLMSNDKGFSIIDERIPNKKESMKMLIPSEELLEDVFLNKVHQKPYLEEKQIYKKPTGAKPSSNEELIQSNVKKLIHENTKINISLKNNSYLRNTAQHTKLSIHVDALKGYLLKLCNKTKTQEEWLAILNVDKNYLDSLKNLHPFFKHIIQTVIEPALFNFTSRTSASALKKKVQDEYKHFISEESQNTYYKTAVDEYDLQQAKLLFIVFKQYYSQYSSRLFELCDKCCQRKNEHVDYVIQSIYYSIYKYFLTTVFIDARGRTYMYLVLLNILTNPSAKMFVNLYDPNEGQFITSAVLQQMASLFKFSQTRDKIMNLARKTVMQVQNTNIEKIYEYILNYLNISLQDLKNIITNNYYLKYDVLMTYLLPVIKKPKRLHYVHSMILYEQARHRYANDRTICNYFEKDGSSSGYQVMSGAFNNKQLAIMANLIGSEDYKLYNKATEYTYTDYKTLLNFARVGLRGLNSSDILETYQAGFDLNYNAFTQEDLKMAIDAGSSDILLSLLIKTDFETSPILIDMLHAVSVQLNTFIKNKEHDERQILQIFEHLPTAYHKLFFLLKKKLRFENLEDALMSTFCLRFSVRICYISERVLGISHDQTSLWHDRELSKDAIMTRLYGSTAYGRKENIIDKLKDKYLMPAETKHLLQEFAYFIQKSINTFLIKETNINILDEFADRICGDKEIIIENRNFKITLCPRETIDFQVSCSTFSGRRGAQLVIKKFSSLIDRRKLRSMFLANFAHSMDADIMHYFCELVIRINEHLKQMAYEFRLVYERNHDCFFTNCPVLLDILVEEAYLLFFAQNNMKNIKDLDPEIVKYFQEMTPEEFLKLLNPLNPYFIK